MGAGLWPALREEGHSCPRKGLPGGKKESGAQLPGLPLAVLALPGGSPGAEPLCVSPLPLYPRCMQATRLSVGHTEERGCRAPA